MLKHIPKDDLEVNEKLSSFEEKKVEIYNSLDGRPHNDETEDIISNLNLTDRRNKFTKMNSVKDLH